MSNVVYATKPALVTSSSTSPLLHHSKPCAEVSGLLTSDRCLAELDRKRQAAEEKERNKRAREEKQIQQLKQLEEKK